MDVTNTGAVWKNFSCQSLAARGSSKISLQTGRNQNLKICHHYVFMSYASRVNYSCMGAAGTVSAKPDCWCYPWAWAVTSWTSNTRPWDWSRRARGYWHLLVPMEPRANFWWVALTHSWVLLSKKPEKLCGQRTMGLWLVVEPKRKEFLIWQLDLEQKKVFMYKLYFF